MSTPSAQPRTATIAASLNDVLAQIDRLDKEVARIDDPLLFYDAVIALAEARRHIRAALKAAQAAQASEGDTRGQRAEAVEV